MMRLSHYNGNPYVGVYCAVNEDYAFVPRDASENLINDIKVAMGVQIVKCNIAGTNLIGSLLSMNSQGAVVSNMTTDTELELLSEYLPVYRIHDKVNASGNNILANDNGAIANPELGKKTIRSIEETLKVDVVQSVIAEHATVGSVCVATNKGVLCHPASLPEERDLIERVKAHFRKGAAPPPPRLRTGTTAWPAISSLVRICRASATCAPAGMC